MLKKRKIFSRHFLKLEIQTQQEFLFTRKMDLKNIKLRKMLAFTILQSTFW